MPKRILIGTLVLTLAAGCATTDDGDGDAAATPPVIEILAQGLTLSGPEVVAPGWTTVRFRNESGMAHFALLERFPEGRGISDHQEVLAPIFQEGMDHLNAGDGQAAGAVFATFPAWVPEIVYLGGPGLTAAGATSEVTLWLEPGTYLFECYVKTDGIFHAYNPEPDTYGMLFEFTVAGDPSDGAEPEADVSIAISSTSGFTIEGMPTSGRNVVRVYFEDQTVHENFLGHDIHVARLSEDSDLEALAAWMDWSRPGGLETPSPVHWVGGLHDMPAGRTGYLHLDLEPGRYAWVAEVTNPAGKGMLVEFTVE
jgi:hypothetical protein